VGVQVAKLSCGGPSQAKKSGVTFPAGRVTYVTAGRGLRGRRPPCLCCPASSETTTPWCRRLPLRRVRAAVRAARGDRRPRPGPVPRRPQDPRGLGEQRASRVGLLGGLRSRRPARATPRSPQATQWATRSGPVRPVQHERPGPLERTGQFVRRMGGARYGTDERAEPMPGFVPRSSPPARGVSSSRPP
jgi:hypothetical protein